MAGADIAPYEYYADGNLKTDIRRNLQFRYNLLNLPSVVTDSYGQQVKTRYDYLADGTKMAVRDGDGYGYAYRGSFVYRTLPNGGEYLESIAHDEGRIIAVTSSTGTSTQFIDTWHVKDYLGSVRAVLDITKDTTQVSDPAIAILEQNDYLPFGIRMSVDTLAYDQSNRYRFNGKEEQVAGGLGLIDYGARFYDNLYPRWTTPDPLAEKYYSVSPYVFCNNNPVNFVDPDGRSTWVVANPNGTYTIEGGNINDNDLNIYVVTYDDDGNMNIGESIGKTSSITSFYDSDKDDNGIIKGWKIGSIVNPIDRSGWEFIAELVVTDPSLVEYMLGARTNERYDFKVTNGTNSKVADIDIYRGMPISKDVNGTIIYSSARDIGNIMAGYIAGKKGLSWRMSRLGFDGYQMWSNIRNKKWPRVEGPSTRNAQYFGWKIANTQ